MKRKFETAQEIEKRLGIPIDIINEFSGRAPIYAMVAGQRIFPAVGVTDGQFRNAATNLILDNQIKRGKTST